MVKANAEKMLEIGRNRAEVKPFFSAFALWYTCGSRFETIRTFERGTSYPLWRRGEAAMVNTLANNQQPAERQLQISVSRTFEPEEFEADTDEERTVILLAERRRLVLMKLNTKQLSPALLPL